MGILASIYEINAYGLQSHMGSINTALIDICWIINLCPLGTWNDGDSRLVCSFSNSNYGFSAYFIERS